MKDKQTQIQRTDFWLSCRGEEGKNVSLRLGKANYYI